MAFPADVLQSPAGGVALQTTSLLFNAAGIAAGALRPPSRTIIGNPQPGDLVDLLDSLTIDVTVQEVHTADSDVTEHPVEQGADVSDHVRPKPVELKLEGLITDTPIDDSLINAAVRAVPGLALGAAVASTVRNLLAGASLTRQAFDTLRKIRDSGAPVSIFTPYRSYSNMVMSSLTITRDRDAGEALKFTAVFREIILVGSSTATIVLPASAQEARDLGAQATSTANSKLTKSVSTLYSGVNSATGGGLDAYKAWVTQ